ncbi:MAG: hypothetical protein RSC43_01560 [Clostridia bacterium]
MYAKVFLACGNRASDGVQLPSIIVGSNPTEHLVKMFASWFGNSCLQQHIAPSGAKNDRFVIL